MSEKTWPEQIIDIIRTIEHELAATKLEHSLCADVRNGLMEELAEAQVAIDTFMETSKVDADAMNAWAKRCDELKVELAEARKEIDRLTGMVAIMDQMADQQNEMCAELTRLRNDLQKEQHRKYYNLDSFKTAYTPFEDDEPPEES